MPSNRYFPSLSFDPSKVHTPLKVQPHQPHNSKAYNIYMRQYYCKSKERRCEKNTFIPLGTKSGSIRGTTEFPVYLIRYSTVPTSSVSKSRLWCLLISQRPPSLEFHLRIANVTSSILTCASSSMATRDASMAKSQKYNDAASNIIPFGKVLDARKLSLA